jgi:aryl-alcohol dehydrogenase-like predicted oxidoreductase
MKALAAGAVVARLDGGKPCSVCVCWALDTPHANSTWRSPTCQRTALLLPLLAADAAGSTLPRVASLQNAYSLMCRTFDAGLAEVCHLEGVALLAYSPLAMGLLTVRLKRLGGGAGWQRGPHTG